MLQQTFDQIRKRFLKISAIIIILLIILFFAYFNNTRLVNDKTSSLYYNLKESLRNRGYSDRLLVISTKRIGFHNSVQVKLSGAASKSKHLSGEAIDFLVFDVNKDGTSDKQDVDVVFELLDNELLKGKGGIGTYKNESSFFNRQMIHIDCREQKARWHR